jgi:hypothetical protein
MKKTIIAAVLLSMSAAAFAGPPHHHGHGYPYPVYVPAQPHYNHHQHRNRDRLWQGVAIGVVGGILLNEANRRREPAVEYSPPPQAAPPRPVRECYVEVTYDRAGQRTETRTCYNRPGP